MGGGGGATFPSPHTLILPQRRGYLSVLQQGWPESTHAIMAESDCCRCCSRSADDDDEIAMPSRMSSNAVCSTVWLDAAEHLDTWRGMPTGEPQPHTTTPIPLHLVEPGDVLREILAGRPDEQVEELQHVAHVFSEGNPQLKVDHAGRLVFRITITHEIAGGGIHAILSVIIPPAYPAVGHSLFVRVTSRRGAKGFLATITKELQEQAMVKAGVAPAPGADDGAESHHQSSSSSSFFANADPACALIEMMNCAKGLLCDMPLAKIAESYCTCVDCNTRLLKQKLDKFPQPSMRRDTGDYVCLTCGNVALHLRQVLPIHDDDDSNNNNNGDVGTTSAERRSSTCTFCFVDDNPLVFLDCGCVSCLECFNRFCDIAISAKALRKLPFGRGQKVLQKHDRTPSATQLLRELVGVPCPAHPNDPRAVIYDPALLKLLPPRTYNRFNFFAMEFTFDKQPGVMYCPLPTCCGYVFITDQPGNVVECPFCGEMFCTRCFNSVEKNACTCQSFGEAVRLSALSLAERYGVPALYEHRQRERLIEFPRDRTSSHHHPNTPSPPPQQQQQQRQPSVHDPDGGWVLVLVTLRSKQLPLRLPLRGVWYPILADFVVNSQLCPYGQQHRAREDVFLAVFHGALLDPAAFLGDQLLFTGAVLFVVETFHADDFTLRKVHEAAQRAYFCAKSDVSHLLERKKCPVCTKPVIHYLNHGCHMIYGCHPGMPEWCYVCGSVVQGHRCAKGCALFCKFKAEKDYHGRLVITHFGCDCPLCPDCKPMRPCENCTLCPMCTMDGVTSLL